MTRPRRHARLPLASVVLFLGVAAMLQLAGCTPGPTPSASGPRPTSAAPTAQPSGATTSPAASASEGAPGSIAVGACPPVPSNTACLGQAPGTVSLTARPGSSISILLVVHNPGGTPSNPIAMLLYTLDGEPLPLGQPACTTCNSTVGKTVIGLEWPALAPGETRTVSVEIPISGGVGPHQVFADLYARSLVDVLSDETANGITPGVESWKLALSVG